jgi:hypothetical protein
MRKRTHVEGPDSLAGVGITEEKEAGYLIYGIHAVDFRGVLCQGEIVDGGSLREIEVAGRDGPPPGLDLPHLIETKTSYVGIS